MSTEWKLEPKHIFILSDAGKPIWSRHSDGDDDEHFAGLAGVIAGHVGFVEDMEDHIRAIHVNDDDGGPSIVFLNKGPLILVAVSRGVETVTQLVVQLTYMYHQVLYVVVTYTLFAAELQNKNSEAFATQIG